MVVSQPLAQVPGAKSWERAAARLSSSRTERAGTEQSQARRLLLLGPGMSYQNHSLRQESFTKSFTLWGTPPSSYKKLHWRYLCISLSHSLLLGSLNLCPNYKKWRTSIFEIPFHLMS